MNLFVVCQIGQLLQAQEFIREQFLQNCSVLILFTNDNLEMPKLIRQLIDKTIFNTAEYMELPVNSNRVHLKNIRKMNADYEKSLDKLNPSELFLFSFDRHYALLAKIADSRKVPVNLLEEGLSTYRLCSEDTDHFPIGIMYEISDILRIWKGTLLLKAVRSSLGFLKEIPRYPRMVYETIKVVFYAEIPTLIWIRLSGDKAGKIFLERRRDFEKVFVAFPEMIASSVRTNKISEFFMHKSGTFDEEASKIIAEYQIGPNTILYVSQKFNVDLDLFASTTVSSLKALSEHFDKNILIKPHPKEDPSFAEKVVAAIEKDGLSKRIRFLGAEHIPVESIIKNSDCFALAGICSSALVYSKKIRPIKCFSIAEYMISQLRGKTKPHQLKLMKDLVKIVSKFDNVQMLNQDLSENTANAKSAHR